MQTHSVNSIADDVDNPLLNFSGLPRFSALTSDYIAPGIEALIARVQRVIDTLADSTDAPTWDNVVSPLDDATEQLARAWGQVSHLNAVQNAPALREAYNSLLPVVTTFWTALAQDERLYAKYRQLQGSPSFASLSPAQRRAIENELRDFRLGGAELSATQKLVFQQAQEELSTLCARFSDNVLDATNAFALYIDDESLLAGIPDDVKQAARDEALADNPTLTAPRWKLTLRAPCYLPVMQYAHAAELRRQLYFAYYTRASELGEHSFDNTPLMTRILALRQQIAHLLGYQNYAEVSLATKMADTPAEVIAFLNELAEKSRPFALNDIQALREFALSEFGLHDMAAWDVSYLAEKLREKRYAFSDDEIKQYFPEDAVLAGLFRLVETLYGVAIKESKAETWHPGVRFFEVHDVRRNNARIGQFYLDLYARSSKRGGAWMDDAINRRSKQGHVQTPVAYLTCNFSAPVGGRPALFTHDQVITLFHEFGHGLHLLLTQVDELNVSGINGVEWDAVELPSQFMENFCWEWQVLQHMTRHVDTDMPLPRALFDKMLAAKHFQSGAFFTRQLEFGLLDMHLHTHFDPAHDSLPDLVARIRKQVAVIDYPAFIRQPNQFSHIFGGGYAAGYYSYKWAEVLSADAYSAFEESGVLSAQTGQRFRQEILAAGGSRPAMESFIAFRGRKPQIEALLRHNGMQADIQRAA